MQIINSLWSRSGLLTNGKWIQWNYFIGMSIAERLELDSERNLEVGRGIGVNFANVQWIEWNWIWPNRNSIVERLNSEWNLEMFSGKEWILKAEGSELCRISECWMKCGELLSRKMIVCMTIYLNDGSLFTSELDVPKNNDRRSVCGEGLSETVSSAMSVHFEMRILEEVVRCWMR